MVQVFLDGELVKTHAALEQGKRTDTGDYPPEKIAFQMRTPVWCRTQAAEVGQACRELIDGLLYAQVSRELAEIVQVGQEHRVRYQQLRGRDPQGLPVQVDHADPVLVDLAQEADIVGVPGAVRIGYRDHQVTQGGAPRLVRPHRAEYRGGYRQRPDHPPLHLGPAQPFVPGQPLGELTQPDHHRILPDRRRYRLEHAPRRVTAGHLPGLERHLVATSRREPCHARPSPLKRRLAGPAQVVGPRC